MKRNNIVDFLLDHNRSEELLWKGQQDLVSESIANVISSRVFGKRFELSDPTSAERCNLLNAYHLFGAQRSVGYLFCPFLRHLPGNLFGSKVDERTLKGFLKLRTKFNASNALLLTKTTFGILLTATWKNQKKINK